MTLLAKQLDSEVCPNTILFLQLLTLFLSHTRYVVR